MFFKRKENKVNTYYNPEYAKRIETAMSKETERRSIYNIEQIADELLNDIVRTIEHNVHQYYDRKQMRIKISKWIEDEKKVPFVNDHLYSIVNLMNLKFGKRAFKTDEYRDFIDCDLG